MNDTSVRSIQSVRLLLACGAKEGIAPQELLAGSHITPDTVSDELALVPSELEYAVLDNLLARAPDAAFAFRAGLRTKVSTLGVLGYAMVTSRTVRDAIETGLRFQPLTIMHCDVQLRVAGDEGMLLLGTNDVPEKLRAFVVDWNMGALFRVLRDSLQAPGVVIRIHVTHAQNAPDDLYREAVGCIPSFERMENLIAFRADLLDARLPLHDPFAHRQALALCDQEMARYRSQSTSAGRIRDLLLRSASAMPSFEEIARRMLVTPRTLRRRLVAEGTTFRDLAEDVREHLARQHLLDRAQSIQQVSDSLGYRDVAAFTTAFKRWTGATPAAWRREMQESRGEMPHDVTRGPHSP